MGHHLKYEGIKDFITKIGPTENEKPAGPSVEEANKDWKRLFTDMRGWK